MKFGQLINITLEIFFCKNHAENEAVRLVFCFQKDLFKKASYEIKANGQYLSFIIFW